MRQIPNDIILPFLKKAEGVKLKAYQDSKGVWTIGVGHTNGVSSGMVISSAQVDQFLDEDLYEAQVRLEKVVKDTSVLSEHQYSAILSFVFNLGANGSWTIWKTINSGKLDEVPNQLARFVYAGKQKLEGLVNRRNAEIALWNEQDDAIKVIDTQLVKETPSAGTLRDLSTPPAVAPETRPLLQQKSVQASIGAAVLGAPTAIQKVMETLEPWKHNSHYVQNLIEYAGTAGALAAVAGVGFLAWRQYRARH
jgi:lysozyme